MPRPKKAKKNKKSVNVNVYMTPAQAKIVERNAAAAGLASSTYARMLILKAIDESESEGKDGK